MTYGLIAISPYNRVVGYAGNCYGNRKGRVGSNQSVPYLIPVFSLLELIG
jgi:hypothetical protein